MLRSVVDRNGLAAVLRVVRHHLDRPGTDVAWTSFATADDLRSLDSSTFYLGRGAEVPFRSEHVVDLGPVPANPVQVPTRSWPRT